MKCRLIILFIALQLALQAKPIYHFDASCRETYYNVISGKLPVADKQIQQIKKQQPDNNIAFYLEDFSGFVNIFLLEDENDFSVFLKKSESIEAQIEKGDIASPYHLYCLSEVLLHRAFVQFIFDEYWSGFWNMRKAYLMLLDNQKKFPSFIANRKNIAMINALTGILPSNYYWAIKMLGIKPDLQGGLATLEKLVNETKSEDFIFRDETVLMYGSLLFHAGADKNDAITLYKNNNFPKPDNLLSHLIYINILLHSNRNEECEKIICNIPQTNEYVKLPALNYHEGMLRLQQLKPDAAKYFTAYIATTKNKNFIKNTYHKIAWSYLIQGNEKLYRDNMNKVLTEGKATRETDKQAEKEAKQNEIPNVEILKARLLFDGGYYEKSLLLLNNVKHKNLEKEKDKVELIYRKARVNDALGNAKTAIELYKETIQKGESLPHYFAANAALQLGYIYEKQNNKEEAKKYFNKCLSLKEHEYVNSLSQKAKVALERLN